MGMCLAQHGCMHRRTGCLCKFTQLCRLNHYTPYLALLIFYGLPEQEPCTLPHEQECKLAKLKGHSASKERPMLSTTQPARELALSKHVAHTWYILHLWLAT